VNVKFREAVHMGFTTGKGPVQLTGWHGSLALDYQLTFEPVTVPELVDDRRQKAKTASMGGLC
jgi:hypothetical protein